MCQCVIGNLLGSISEVQIQSLTRKYRGNGGKNVFKPIKALATPALMVLNRNELSVSLKGSSRLGLPGTLAQAREAKGTVWMLGKRVHCCPAGKCCSVFTLWQRVSKLIEEYQNFLPVLLFPPVCWGPKSEILLTFHDPRDVNSSWCRLYWIVGGQDCPAGPAPESWPELCCRQLQPQGRVGGEHQQAAYEGFLVGHFARGIIILGLT